MRLYEISDRYRQVLERALETEDDAEALTHELETITDAFADKAENVARFIRNLEADADAHKAEADRLAARGKALQANSDRLRDYLASEMRRCNLSELKAGLNTLKFQKNPWAVEIENANDIPWEYKTEQKIIPPAPDKPAIAHALKLGVVVPGARLVQGERLVLK